MSTSLLKNGISIEITVKKFILHPPNQMKKVELEGLTTADWDIDLFADDFAVG